MCSAWDADCSQSAGSPIRTSPDQCALTAPRSFSQLATSFFAFLCLGIPTRALSSLTIKFPAAPAPPGAATASALTPAARLPLARSPGPGGNSRKFLFLSRFTSDLFQTLRTRLPAPRPPPQASGFPFARTRAPRSARRTRSFFALHPLQLSKISSASLCREINALLHGKP